MTNEPAAGGYGEHFAWLVEHMHPVDRKPYSTVEIGEALGVTRSYVWQMLTGEKAMSEGIRADIARLFGVPKEYFDDDAVRAEVQAEILALERRATEAVAGGSDPREDVGARFLALRALGLQREAESRGVASAFQEALREYEAQPRDRRRRRKRDPS